MSPEQLLQKWTERIPRDGADCEDALSVMRYLGMEVEQTKNGHWKGKHSALRGSVYFPYGILVINCHAFGKQGKAHPDALKDIVRVAEILHEED